MSDRHDDSTANDGERGASLVEYALLVALIAIVCVGAVTFLGTTTSDRIDQDTRSLFQDG